ncbi:uncharacterized protein LOC143027232 isoform X2 [Oratosquilla oratoria]|uniref:uncharacterized protein LOC143027232 isoform X2 n=1 Tax=Oratosquilla oratoria TaxID=337810 RepID=UPI003F75EC99
MAKAAYAVLLILLFRLRDGLAVSGMESKVDYSPGPWNLVMALWRPSHDTSSTSSSNHPTKSHNKNVTEYPQIQGKAIHVILDSPGEIVDLKSKESSALMALLQMSQNFVPLQKMMHDPLSAKDQQAVSTVSLPQLQWRTVVPAGNDPETVKDVQTLPSTTVTKEQDQHVTQKGSFNIARDKMSLTKDVNIGRESPQIRNNNDRISTTPTLKIDINGPIYEEISTTLNTDTSISDVEDYDLRIKQTENNDKYIPKANLSSVNLVDIKLHRPVTLNKASESTPGSKNPGGFEGNEGVTTINQPFHSTTGEEASSLNFSSTEVSSDTPSTSRATPLPPSLVTASAGLDRMTSQNNVSIQTVNPGPRFSLGIAPPHLLVTIKSPKRNSSSNTTSSSGTGTTEPSSSTTATVYTSSYSEINSGISTTTERKSSSDRNTLKTSATRPAEENREASFVEQINTSNYLDKSSLCSFSNLTECVGEEYVRTGEEEIEMEDDKKVLEERVKVMMDVMDTSTDPCDDFYQYACGNWSQVFTMRADRGVYNTFEVLREDVDEILKSLLEEPICDDEANVTKGIKVLYKSCMDTELIESQGPEPLLDLLKELGGWPVLEGNDWCEETFKLEKQMADLRIYNNAILVSETVGTNLQDSSQNILQLDQTDLGLPGREYFLNPGDEKFRKAYFQLMMKVCELLGVVEDVAKTNMRAVLDFEIELAKILVPLEARHNLTALHRKMTVQELVDEVPQIDWLYYLERVTDRRVNASTEIMVFALSYFQRLVPLLNNTNKRTVSNYLLWRFVKNRISNLGSAFQKAKQAYISVLFGMTTQPERWRTCVNYINGNLEYPLGGLFVKRYFPESSKNATEGIMAGLREALVQTIRHADWMSAATRTVAEEKVDTMVKHVGYPDVVLNNTALDLLYSEACVCCLGSSSSTPRTRSGTSSRCCATIIAMTTCSSICLSTVTLGTPAPLL